MEQSSFRDRLKAREESDGREAWAGLTLNAVLGCEKRPPPGYVNRTLNDIIRHESNGYRDVLGQPPQPKMTWKSFKERLRIRRAGAGANWTSTMHVPTSDVPTTRSQLSRRQSGRVLMYTTEPPETPTRASGESPRAPENNPHSPEAVQANPVMRPQFSRHNSVRAPSLSSKYSRADSTRLSSSSSGGGSMMSRRLSAALAEEQRELQRAESGLGGREEEEEEEEEDEDEDEDEDEEEEEEEGPAAAPRMSLMALLEETDRKAGIVGPTYVFDEEEDEDEDEEEDGESGDTEYSCCVCMVRHKGSAFIPCGHTFCRLCSRELWVSRSNCPLCNGFILEILDIF